MTEQQRPKLVKLMPALRVCNVFKSQEFYETVLGFQCLQISPVDALLVRDNLHLELSYGDVDDPRWPGCFEFALQVDDLDREIIALQKHGLAIGEDPIEYVSDIQSTRSILISDVDQYRIRIFEQRWTTDPAYRPRIKQVKF